MKKLFLLLAVCGFALPLAGCWHCPICYEDDWSRTPFPGEQTQHIPTPDPATIPD